MPNPPMHEYILKIVCFKLKDRSVINNIIISFFFFTVFKYTRISFIFNGAWKLIEDPIGK